MQKHTTPSAEERAAAEEELSNLHNLMGGMGKLFHAYMRHDALVRSYEIPENAPKVYRLNEWESEAVVTVFLNALDRSHQITDDYV